MRKVYDICYHPCAPGSNLWSAAAWEEGRAQVGTSVFVLSQVPLTPVASTAFPKQTAPESTPLRLPSCGSSACWPSPPAAVCRHLSMSKTTLATPLCQVPVFFYTRQSAISSWGGRFMWIRACSIKMRLVVGNRKAERQDGTAPLKTTSRTQDLSAISAPREHLLCAYGVPDPLTNVRNLHFSW